MFARSRARTHVFARKRALSSGRQFRPLVAFPKLRVTFLRVEAGGGGEGVLGG